MFRKRHWAKPEGISGIKDQDLKKQLCLRKERTYSGPIALRREQCDTQTDC
jgi:hypothetical protein